MHTNAGQMKKIVMEKLCETSLAAKVPLQHAGNGRHNRRVGGLVVCCAFPPPLEPQRCKSCSTIQGHPAQHCTPGLTGLP